MVATANDDDNRIKHTYDVDSDRLETCPKCGAKKWTCRGGSRIDGGDLFIRGRVRCRACGFECSEREVTPNGH